VLLPLVIPIRLLLLRYYDLYRIRGEFSFVEDMARVFKATAIGSLLIVPRPLCIVAELLIALFIFARVFLVDFLLALAGMARCECLARRPNSGAPFAASI